MILLVGSPDRRFLLSLFTTTTMILTTVVVLILYVLLLPCLRSEGWLARVTSGGCPLDFPALPFLRAVASSRVYASAVCVGHAAG